MANGRRVNTVLGSIFRLDDSSAAERKLFSRVVGAGTFNLLGSLLGGFLMFLLLYSAARWATETDARFSAFCLRRQIEDSIRPIESAHFYS